MGQNNSLHMVDPATWSVRTAQLHAACGNRIAISEDGCVAQRMDATKQHKDGLVHTAWPVAVGRLFQVCSRVPVCAFVCAYMYIMCMLTIELLDRGLLAIVIRLLVMSISCNYTAHTSCS